MKHSALLLCAGIVAATGFACALPPAAAPPGGDGGLRIAACKIRFPDDVLILDPNFGDPTSANRTPTGTAAPQYIKDDLQAAYNRASPRFRTQLCQLDGVFITDAKQSWGFRNIIDKKRYIALSNSLWAGDSKRPTPVPFVDDYPKLDLANKTLHSLLPLSNDPNPPRYVATSASPNDGTETLLAMLAHEFGHVLWNDILIDPPDTAPNFSGFCPRVFPVGSWTNLPAKNRWQKFGTIIDDPNTNLPNDPNDPQGGPALQLIAVKWLIASLNNNQFTKAHFILLYLHGKTRPWPSLFGAYSVNEDFVETFTLHTLTEANPPLQSLKLDIPIGNIRVPRDIPATITQRPLLSAKLQCFDSWFALHPP